MLKKIKFRQELVYMKRFSKNKNALLLACITLLGNRTSAMDTSLKPAKKPQTIGAVTSSKKSNLTKLKIAGIIGGSILGAGLIYEILGDTILDVPTILKCIKNKSSNDPKTPEKTKPIENEKNITDSQKLKEPNIENSKFLEFLGGNKKHSKSKLTNEDGTLNIENTKKFLENKEKPKDKEMSNEEINTMLDKMLKILGSFGSNDPQFLEEYNEAVKDINDEKQKKNIYDDKLLDFRRQNKGKYYKNIKIEYINGGPYDSSSSEWFAFENVINFFPERLMSFKDEKIRTKYNAKFTNNSVKYKGGDWTWKLELINDNSLCVQEWRFNGAERTYCIKLTLCE